MSKEFICNNIVSTNIFRLCKDFLDLLSKKLFDIIKVRLYCDELSFIRMFKMVALCKKSQSGRSMIEMLGVLAIVGILSAGGIAGYSMAMGSYKTNELMDKVTLVAQQTRSMYDGVYIEDVADETFGNIGGQLVAGSFVPDLDSPFGGKLKTSPSAGGDVFYIEAQNVPQEACVKVMITDWGRNGTIKSISANEHSVETFPANPDDAVTACADKNNTMTWTIN